jgi:hypothetical protein
MDLRALLVGFMVWVLYPIWLLAGALDYLCHRRTDIERTSGPAESWLHLAQFLCLASALTLALAFELSAVVWLLMVAIVLMHSVLSYFDVAYTDGRRRISPLEQQIHGYMEVIPLVVVGLIGLAGLGRIGASDALQLSMSPLTSEQWFLFGSFVVLAGVPVLEELLRTLRVRPSRHARVGNSTSTHFTATSHR